MQRNHQRSMEGPDLRAAWAWLGVLVASACASSVMTDAALEANTAAALGLSKGSFTIGERIDRGVKTTYNVQTKAGKSYRCYVEGSVSMVGRGVSEAVCHEPDKNDSQAELVLPLASSAKPAA